MIRKEILLVAHNKKSEKEKEKNRLILLWIKIYIIYEKNFMITGLLKNI